MARQLTRKKLGFQQDWDGQSNWNGYNQNEGNWQVGDMKFFVAKNDIKGMVVHYGSNIFF